jgi:four helix bundle protein
MSRGSLLEIESLLFISQKLNYLDIAEYDRLSAMIVEISKMLNKLITTLENKINVH